MALAGCGDPAQPFGGDPRDAQGTGGVEGGSLGRGKGGSTNIFVVTGVDSGIADGSPPTTGSDGATPGSGGASGGARGTGGTVGGSGGGSGTGGSTTSGGTTGTGGTKPASGGAPGSGGRATGGATGTGGRASGGATASGGQGTGGRGTGGASSTGGVTASGGAPSTGGAASTGGLSGSGGARATGGAQGTGGTPSTDPECEKLIRQYDDELAKARECKVLLEGCGTVVPAKLAGCGSTCTTFVAKADKLDQLRQKWGKAQCVAPDCPGHVCDNPLAATCSLLTGMCTDLL